MAPIQTAHLPLINFSLDRHKRCASSAEANGPDATMPPASFADAAPL